MVLDVHPAELLHKPDRFWVDRELVMSALELALLGNIDHARELVEILLRAGPVSPQDTYRNLRDLLFAWVQSGRFPDKLPKSYTSAEAIDAIEKIYEAEWGDVKQTDRVYDQSGLAKCLEMPDTDTSDATSGSSAMDKGQRMIKALDICLSLHQPIKNDRSSSDDDERDWMKVTDLDERSADLVRKITRRWGANQQLHYLAHAKRLWPLFAHGVLADGLGLSRQQLKAKGSMLVAAFSERLRRPYVPTFLESRTVKELLDIGDYNTLAPLGPAVTHMGPNGDRAQLKTLFKKPASFTEVSEAEKRLNVSFPADYKEFLRASNGFGFQKNGIYNGISYGPELHNLENLQWRFDDYMQTSIILIETGSLLYQVTNQKNWKTEHGDWDMTEDLPRFERFLEIGCQDVESILLVPPEDVSRAREAYMKLYNMAEGELKVSFKRAIESFAGSMEDFERMEWCCLVWDEGMMFGHKSFKHWLEREVSGSFICGHV